MGIEATGPASREVSAHSLRIGFLSFLVFVLISAWAAPALGAGPKWKAGGSDGVQRADARDIDDGDDDDDGPDRKLVGFDLFALLELLLPPPDACADNQAPLASFSHQQLEGTLSLAFDAGSSSDPEQGELTYEWDFGDGSPLAGGRIIEHEFPAADTYLVTLTVWDDCDAADTLETSVDVEPTGPQPLQADFKVYELVYVAPVTEEEEWVEIDLENEEVELGLRVLFDASTSTGAAYYCFAFGDATYNTNFSIPTERHAYDEPGDYTVTLTVYDASGMNMDVFSRVVHVVEGMQLLAWTDHPGEDFFPMASCVDGGQVWAISQQNSLGTADFSDPNDPDGIYLMSTEALPGARSLTVHDGYLYVANRSAGVPIYRADPGDFELLGRIDAGELGGDPADFVAVVEDTLYVASAEAGEFRIFDLVQPTAPAYLGSRLAQGYIWKLSSPGATYVAARIGGNQVEVFDCLDPRNPQGLWPLTLSDAGGGLNSSASVAGAALGSGTQLITVRVADSHVSAELAGVAGLGASHSVITERRMYLVWPGAGIYRYDITDRNNPYFMDEEYVSSAMLSTGHILDPDGEGPLTPVLIVGCGSGGFYVYAP